MGNARDVVGARAVFVIIHKTEVGRGTKVGKYGPVTSEMLEILEIDPIIVQKSSRCDIKIQLPAHSKTYIMLQAEL